uniref:Large ribosomal subunit protein bL9c n=1 Tax=Pterocladia lucida TaxID=31408 RepID=A0A6M3WWK6_PTELU|nr:ribosomal protein L19 [Pterocladia lucida]
MSKSIHIILKNKHNQLGLKEEINIVKRGYARNYLIPNDIAEVATKGKIKHLSMLKEIKNNQLKEEKNKAIDTKKYLEQTNKIKLRKRVSDQNSKQIFGSVTEKEIIEKIFQTTGIHIEKKQIFMPDIKQIGIYKIQIKIITNIDANLDLHILPDNIE